MTKLSGYELSRAWFDFSFTNPELINPNHSALYFFAIEHCNRLGWKSKFGLPTTMAMEAIGIKSYNTYKKTLTDLIEWGFITMVQKSTNQYSSNIIALSKIDKAPDKALDKALTKHTTKQSEYIKTIEPYNKEQLTISDSQIAESKELFNELKKTFLEFYKLKTENEYYFTAKDANNLKQLGRKLFHSIRNKGDTPSIQDAVSALSYIMQHHNDKWIDANFSIPILNSKYNEIISGIKQRHVKGTSDQQLAEILAKHING